MSAGRRWRWVASALVAGVLVAGCQAPRPEVTFFGNRTSVDTGPTQWCQIDQARLSFDCTDTTPDDIPRLALKSGDHVQINVPAAIGDTPWWVYFRYLTADGTLADGRTPLFSDGRLAYTLSPLTPQDQLTYVEVQSDFVPGLDEEGAVTIRPTHRWLLLIDPLTGATAQQQ